MDTRENTPMEHKNRHEEDDIRGKGLSENADELGVNENVSGDDRSDEGRESRRFHQEHGNRKYKSYRNHSSADDQPTTDTGA